MESINKIEIKSIKRSRKEIIMIVITFHYRKANTKLLNESNRYVSLCVLFSFVYLEEKLNFSGIAQIFRKVKELWKAKITNSAVTAINVNKCT